MFTLHTSGLLDPALGSVPAVGLVPQIGSSPSSINTDTAGAEEDPQPIVASDSAASQPKPHPDIDVPQPILNASDSDMLPLLLRHYTNVLAWSLTRASFMETAVVWMGKNLPNPMMMRITGT